MTRRFRRGVPLYSGFQYLKGRLDAESLLEDLGIDVAYRLGKNQIMCHCPDLGGAHANGDANPSFGYNEEKMAWNCFVCGGGTVTQLVRLIRGGSEEDAIKFLEMHSDLTPSSPNDLTAKVQLIMHPIEEVNPIPEYPRGALNKFTSHPYFLERGISQNVIEEMKLCFDEAHCGVIIPHFFGGKLTGWQTRHLAMLDDVYICDVCEREKEVVPKYKSTPSFPKENTLYNYDGMKMALREVDEAIVVESPMTACYLKTLGYNNVVATFGQFNIPHAALLMAIPHVLFWPDNDDAGQKNAARIIEYLSPLT